MSAPPGHEERVRLQEAAGTRFCVWFTACWLVFAVSLAAHAAGTVTERGATSEGVQWRLVPRFESTTGRYGESTATTVDESVLRIEGDDGVNLFWGALSYLAVTADRDVVLSDGRVVSNAGAATQRSTVHGVGDTHLGLKRRLLSPESDLQIGLIGKVKLPTASRERGLGSGKVDYTAQVDVSVDRADWTFWAEGGYRYRGKSAGDGTRDGPLAAIGVAHRLRDGLSVEAAYDYRSPSSEGGVHQSEVSLALYYRSSRSLRIEAYILKGYTDGSPDRGFGAAVVYAF